ncbi:MAG: D-glucuronyl C5-epimerase family protein [Alphaproteobacteria bacterium]|nr:D-glucuronyl C5-epimerase family protein [Alphaproteobacteria bacterium]
MRIIVLLAALAFPLSAFATCPDVSIAPRTGSSTAASMAASAPYSLDETGVLVFDYGKQYNGLGKFHNPYFITNYANLLFKEYLESNCQNASILQKFLIQADWLVKTAERKNGASVWSYPFAQPVFDLKPGWISGIGQSRIAGVLQRAFALTGKDEYHLIAEEAMQVYKRPLAEGGVATRDGGVTWIEEAANPNGTSYKILNGHITALAGILDFYRITGEPEWKELFDRGVAAVHRDIAKFDAGFISYYSLAAHGIRQMAARRDYNSLHVHQLLWLFDETDDPLFLEWASRFQAYEMNTDRYSAKGSIDPKGHGPGEAAGFYGNRYWSHSGFPTWLEIGAESPALFRGIAVHGNGEKSTPRDFSVSARLDGQWRVVAEAKGNADMRRVLAFPSPVKADAFRVDIESDNGNRNVALQAAMPIRAEPQFWPIANECNYRIGRGNYNFDLAFDNDSKTAMRVYCPGWVVVPTGGAEKLTIDARAAEGAMFGIAYSDDLRKWTPAGNLAAQATAVKLPHYKFLKVSFGKDVSEIRAIRLD